MAESDGGDIRGVVLASGLGGAVGGEMLDRNEDATGLGEVIALIAADACTRHGCAEIGIFAGAFHGAAPTGIAADVDHGGVNPANARRDRLFSRHMRKGGGQFRIEAGGHGQGHWIDGAIAVNDVRAKE